jgi:Domain of unknown function (DUF4394)
MHTFYKRSLPLGVGKIRRDMTIKKLTTLTLITLALAATLTFGLMSNHSANAKTNLLNASVTSAASLSAQMSGVPIFALGAGNNTLYLLSGNTFNRVGAISPVNGTVRECDFRTLNNQLMCVTNTGRFYTVNTANANATLVATLSPNNANSQLLDINPMADAFRWVGTDELNYAIVKNAAGVFNTVAVQTSFAYVAQDVNAGRNPNLIAGAYDNNQNGRATTTFFIFDSGTNSAVTIADRTATGSSNTGGGRLVTIGGVFDQNGRVTVTPNSGFDIATFDQLGDLNIGALLTTGKLSFLFTAQVPNIVTPGQIQNLGAFSQPVAGSDGNNQWADVMVPIQ